MVSIATNLNISNNRSISFSTNILVVGGAYAGLSAINTFVNQFKEKKAKVPNDFTSKNPLSITLIEPRAGLLNVLGMPRCIVDEEFSKTQFIPMNKIKNLKFDKIVTKDVKFLHDMVEASKTSQNHEFGIDINFVHGSVIYLDENKAQYKLSNDDDGEDSIINFDYVIMASGRDRSFPTTPKAYNYEYFLNEMKESMDAITSHEIISVIGAGAVGIELAGDFKHYLPNKTINLIHPYNDLPPEESLSKQFKDLSLESLKNAGVNVILNTRVKSENTIEQGITTGNLEIVNAPEGSNNMIQSNLNIWCTTHKNNTAFLSSTLTKKFNTDKNCIKVNDYLQLFNKDTNELIPNFFVIGDLVDFNIVKLAGWALYFGRTAANNLSSLILENKLVEPLVDFSTIPKGMVLVAGNGELICELAGVVSKNVPEYVEEYKDYCFGRIVATIGV